MLGFMKCVAEAIAANGIQGLLEMVPGGKYVYAVGTDALKRHREKKAQKKLEEDLKEMIEAKANAVFAVAKQAVEEAAPQLQQREKELITQYLTALPEAARQSMKRKEDPSGRSLPFGYKISNPEDVAKVLPQTPPRFTVGEWVPGREENWRLERRIGGGGFGEVWLVRHNFKKSERPRAVKFCTHSNSRRKLTEHEKEIIVQVMKHVGDHPNIVPLLEYQLDGESPWLMYEYVEGGTLADEVLSWRKHTSTERFNHAITILHPIVHAVGRCHEMDPPITHRDLKLANVLMERGVPRITDFGIGGATVDYLLTEEKSRGYTSVMGRLPSLLSGSYSLMYSSPQQRNGERPDPRDDVHALGVIAYQMLTGRVDAEVKGNWQKRLRSDGVSETLIDLIGNSTSEEADDRPKDATAWEQTLAESLPKKLAGPGLAPPTERKNQAEEAEEAARVEAERQKEAERQRLEASRLKLEPEKAEGERRDALKDPFHLGRVRSPGENLPLKLPLDVPIAFAWCPPGSFQMGSNHPEAANFDWYKNERPVHKVTLTKGFFMGIHQVTQRQWKVVMGTDPSHFKDPSRPVEKVSWEDCQEFCKKLTAHLKNRVTVRLPTEAEWEYACRAGTTTEYHFGDVINTDLANYEGNLSWNNSPKGEYRQQTTDVGSFTANPWGLFDVHGNVWEWCEDWYGPYAGGDQIDPCQLREQSDKYRVLRGGSWGNNPGGCRAACRLWGEPANRFSDFGFRVCFRLD
jgi:eukaryotic-like serine/threonine-protein kinase